MPHTTFGYAFEAKVGGLASGLAARLGGDEDRSFLMELDEAGFVQTMTFECPEGGWHLATERLEARGVAYLFHDPFDAPEYRYLSWSGVDRGAMERLMRARFEPVDFQRHPHASRAPLLDPPGTFPSSWRVMF